VSTGIGALLFGDYPELAKRCLSPLRQLQSRKRAKVVLGLNAVSPRVRDLVVRLGFPNDAVIESAENLCKYPMMRRILGRLYEDEPGYIMWFDDDAAIRPGVVPHLWMDRVDAAMCSADMIGSLYRQSLQGAQHLWVKDQPWYGGEPVGPGHVVHFAQGSWWTIRSAVLRRWNWPIPELNHRGGDVMLGELCRQQKLRLRSFKEGLFINADLRGRESKSPRRGLNEPPIGFRYQPGVTSKLEHLLPEDDHGAA
jgi:hypothetical protein